MTLDEELVMLVGLVQEKSAESKPPQDSVLQLFLS